MADLSMPEDPGAPGAMHEWCDRVEAHFTENEQPHGVEAAQRIRAALDDDSVDAEKFEEVMAEASIMILRASLLESRDAYKKLITPVENEARKHKEGTSEHTKLSHALDTYRVVVSLFDEAAAALDDPSESGREQMEAAVSKAKAKLAALK